jgi:hypothetical protein
MIKTIAVGAVTLAALAAPSKCSSDSHRGPNPANQQVCADITAANQAGELNDKAHETQIKLDGAKSGVSSGIQHAIDAFYTPDHKGTAQQLLQACTDAGVPQ